ncbi:LysR family transcriptional regulator [Krasilnikovia sp. MM14-A1259]|uniref:LysR family transcriptional regulator n=1 Tax=Krasilnikovia sp. MM14-A1259 TaxID=3373539 RepID=UPI00380D140E
MREGVDLSLLRTCLAVYRAGSLTKAARILGISQPAVTGHLRALESKLDQPLFLRLPSGTVPTDAAHELVRDISAPLDSLEGALSRRLQPERLEDCTVRLAGPAEIITARVLPAISDLVADGLRLKVSLGLTDDLLQELTDGVHDMVIATRRPRATAVHATAFMDEEFALVGDAGWARRLPQDEIAARGAAVLDQVPIIAYAESLPIIRRYWRTIFDTWPGPTAQVTVPDLRAVLTAVKHGAGISVLPTYLCAEEIERGELVVLHDVEVPPLNTLFLAVRAGVLPSTGLTTLRSHLLTKAGLWR